MALIPEWRAILRRAWSVRLIVLAVAFSAAEVAVPLILPGMVPPLVFAGLSALASVGALVSRLILQKDLRP
jgi:hypothetical protein